VGDIRHATFAGCADRRLLRRPASKVARALSPTPAGLRFVNQPPNGPGPPGQGGTALNAIHLTGRLTRDPDLRQLPSGASVCKLRLAVDRMGRSNSTGYIDVTSFGKPAEAAATVLAQGWLVAVSGRLEYGEWESADGAKRSGHQVIGHVEFLAAPKSNGDSASDAAAVHSAPDDDIGF
jgi:single-strand DNA-binding protein